jgi:hypothetical protein
MVHCISLVTQSGAVGYTQTDVSGTVYRTFIFFVNVQCTLIQGTFIVETYIREKLH